MVFGSEWTQTGPKFLLVAFDSYERLIPRDFVRTNCAGDGMATEIATQFEGLVVSQHQDERVTKSALNP